MVAPPPQAPSKWLSDPELSSYVQDLFWFLFEAWKGLDGEACSTPPARIPPKWEASGLSYDVQAIYSFLQEIWRGLEGEPIAAPPQKPPLEWLNDREISSTVIQMYRFFNEMYQELR